MASALGQGVNTAGAPHYARICEIWEQCGFSAHEQQTESKWRLFYARYHLGPSDEDLILIDSLVRWRHRSLHRAPVLSLSLTALHFIRPIHIERLRLHVATWTRS